MYILCSNHVLSHEACGVWSGVEWCAVCGVVSMQRGDDAGCSKRWCVRRGASVYGPALHWPSTHTRLCGSVACKALDSFNPLTLTFVSGPVVITYVLVIMGFTPTSRLAHPLRWEVKDCRCQQLNSARPQAALVLQQRQEGHLQGLLQQ